MYTFEDECQENIQHTYIQYVKQFAEISDLFLRKLYFQKYKFV